MSRIILKDVTKEFSAGGASLRVLKGASFEANPGELTAIIGRSGSGKTTLLNVMGGLLKPTSGSVTVDGVDITRLDEPGLVEYRRKKVGLVFQHFNLIPSLNALENVMLPYQYANGGGAARKRAEEALRSAEIPHRARYSVNVLSGGEQQRVAIARALINNPEIILADEPTGNLDYETGRTIVTLLGRLAHESGKTVVVVTHDEVTRKIADRYVTIRDGVVLSEPSLPRTRVCKTCSWELPIDAKFCMNCSSKQDRDW